MIPNICVELRVMGDGFDPDILTSKLSILPTTTWRKGDKIKNSMKEKKYDCWIFSTGYKRVYNVNDQLDIIYKKFNNQIDMIKKVKKKYTLDISLDIIIEMDSNQTPTLYFEKKTLDFIHCIQSTIDVDMYII